MLGSKILDEARSWEGTPYRWRCRIKGLGADCGTYLHEVMLQFYDIPPMPEGYRENWITEEDGTYWLDWLTPVVEWIDTPEPGDCILVKYGRNFTHGGVIDETGHVWHCYGRKGFAGVTRSPITFFRDRGIMRDHKFWRIRDEFLRAQCP